MDDAAARRRAPGRGLPRGLRSAPAARCRETRTKVVFGAGNSDADLMFVGEAPGAEEDRQGLPFVGRAGGLLTELLSEIGLSRDDVWIGNVLKCRPPGNRDPQPIEIESCRPYLERQVELIQPARDRHPGQLRDEAADAAAGPGSPRCAGHPQVHEIGGRSRVPAAAVSPRGGASHAVARRDAARGLRQAPRAARPASPRPPRTQSPTPAPATSPPGPRPSRRSARPVRLSAAHRRARPRPRRSARGLAAGLRPGDVVLVARRAGDRQDDLGPGRLPGARRHRARHLADLHDRSALRGPRCPSPTSTSTGSQGLEGRGPGAARRLPDRRGDRLRRVAGGPPRRACIPAAMRVIVRVAARVELRHAGGDAREVVVA